MTEKKINFFEIMGKGILGSLLLLTFLPIMVLIPAFWLMLACGILHQWYPMVPLASFGEAWVFLLGLAALGGAVKVPTRVSGLAGISGKAEKKS